MNVASFTATSVHRVGLPAVDGNFTPQHRGGSGSPLVLIHGFTDTWRTWELILPALERRHDVLAITLPGHAGGPPLDGPPTDGLMPDAVERAMDGAGFERAHILGNSLGGYVALQLAVRGRAERVVALAPAGGWAPDDDSFRQTLEFFKTQQQLLRMAGPHADSIVSTDEGRRRATLTTTVRYAHIPAELLAHQIRGAAACSGAGPLIEHGIAQGWELDAEALDCPLRFVWGAEDRLLPWPQAAARYRSTFPQADWITLDDVGHCPQLDVPAETADLILGFTA
jgi:pimeloyl-ACP methyl ester carboxylesterase